MTRFGTEVIKTVSQFVTDRVSDALNKLNEKLCREVCSSGKPHLVWRTNFDSVTLCLFEKEHPKDSEVAVRVKPILDEFNDAVDKLRREFCCNFIFRVLDDEDVFAVVLQSCTVDLYLRGVSSREVAAVIEKLQNGETIPVSTEKPPFPA